MDSEKTVRTIEVNVPKSMLEMIEGTVVRLNGLFPGIEFRALDEGIEASTSDNFDLNQIRSEMFNTLYREVILVRTNDIRAKIIG